MSGHIHIQRDMICALLIDEITVCMYIFTEVKQANLITKIQDKNTFMKS